MRIENMAEAASGRKDDGVGMSPWEQHSAVINLPRFDYNAPSSLLNNSHSGFLITCTISSVSLTSPQSLHSSLSTSSNSTLSFHFLPFFFVFFFSEREKSATKEAISILHKVSP